MMSECRKFEEILFLSFINVKFFAMAGLGRSKYLLTAKINYIIFVRDERAEMVF
jgi:hypothetical protein